MKTINLILGNHNHQPVGNFDFVFENTYKNAYKPFLDILEKYKDYKDNIIVADIEENEISSTKIREMIYNNKRVNDYLDNKVLDYIVRNKLYSK